MIMDKIIENFVRIVMTYPNVDIDTLFNKYLHLLAKEDLASIGEMFPIIIQAGIAARNASPEMQNKLKVDLGIQEKIGRKIG